MLLKSEQVYKKTMHKWSTLYEINWTHKTYTVELHNIVFIKSEIIPKGR